MDLSQLHFAYPWLLWSGIAIPIVWALFFLFYQGHRPREQLEKFIDSHLLPYLLTKPLAKQSSFWKTLVIWSLVWSCLTLALAGPRWSFREMETFSQDQSLVILLDLSESMNGADIKPSRLIRAKQKIEDLLNLSKGVKIGLIAFAADPHMITPITEDKETIRHLLPSLTTDLVYVQGSRLSSALDMASAMLQAEPGNNKALLVISDGGFEDASAIITAKKVAETGIVIHVMGMGTTDGAPLYDLKNTPQKKGKPIFSKLEKERLSEISKAGHGHYLEAHYSDQEVTIVLNELAKRAEAQANIGKKNQFWDEHFHILVLAALPLLLYWFRRGYLFALVLLFLTPAFSLHAAPSTSNFFKNIDELGKQALDEGDWETAINAFQDPYRKGVAYYRAGHFVEAEEMFRLSSRQEVACEAAYNLGNALVQQQKLKEAVAAYEEVLKKWPDHIKAKENLELIKKMQEPQKQDNSQSDDSDQKNEQNENESEKDNKDKSQGDEGQKQPQENKGESNDQSGNQLENQEGEKEREESEEKNAPEPSGQQEMQQEEGGVEDPQKEEQEVKASRSQEDQDADFWLNRIDHDPKRFLKNKFYIESKRNGTKEGIDPW